MAVFGLASGNVLALTLGALLVIVGSFGPRIRSAHAGIQGVSFDTWRDRALNQARLKLLPSGPAERTSQPTANQISEPGREGDTARAIAEAHLATTPEELADRLIDVVDERAAWRTLGLAVRTDDNELLRYSIETLLSINKGDALRGWVRDIVGSVATYGQRYNKTAQTEERVEGLLRSFAMRPGQVGLAARAALDEAPDYFGH